MSSVGEQQRSIESLIEDFHIVVESDRTQAVAIISKLFVMGYEEQANHLQGTLNEVWRDCGFDEKQDISN